MALRCTAKAQQGVACDGFAGRVYAKARQGCAKALQVAAKAMLGSEKQRRCEAIRRLDSIATALNCSGQQSNGAEPMAESELQGLSYDENGNATAMPRSECNGYEGAD